MITQSNWTVAAILMLVTAVAVGSTASVALAQTTSTGTVESKLKDALQGAKQGATEANIGGKIIIVGACTPNSNPPECTWYNTTPIPAAPGG